MVRHALLDTSVCIDLLRGREPAVRLPPVASCALSSITVAELEVGVRRSVRPEKQRAAVDAFVALFRVLPWDAAAAGHYGEIRVALERRGVAIGPLDLLIAAHARSVGAALVTGNLREFRRVPGLDCIAWRLKKATSRPRRAP
jgi:tRNA(fMet)-specific endonuclease VapC